MNLCTYIYSPVATFITQVFVRDPVPTDFERFIIYAQFVRTLHVENNPKLHFDKLGREVFEALSRACHRTLFPNLEWLIYENDIRHLMSFVGPKLEALRINIGEHLVLTPVTDVPKHDQLAALLPDICATSPHLVTLDVELDPREELRGFINVIPNFDRIQMLHIWASGLTPTTHPPSQVQALFQALSLLPVLHTMTLGLSCADSSSIEVPPNHCGEISFPYLRRVAIHDIDASLFLLLLRFFRRPDVQLVGISQSILIEDLSLTYVENWINAIHDYCNLEHLLSIELEHEPHIIFTQSEPVTATMIRPLLAFHNLSDVKLSFGTSPLGIGDSMLHDMVNAWPCLGTLKLWSGANYPPTITFRGLIPLAIHCPNLIELTLPIDPSSLPPPNGRPPGLGHSCPGVIKLVLVNREVKDPYALALFLSDFFPNVSEVLSADERNSYGGSPHPVSELVKMLTFGREQERRRIFLQSQTK